MSEVTLSQGVRQNLLALQNTAALLGKTQERLATGKKVNSALDNPINFFTSSGLQARAGDLGRLLDSVGNALQTLKAADQGITSITKLIESAEAVARQAMTASEAVVTAAATDDTGDLSALDATGGTITINGEDVTLAANDGEAEAAAALQAAATASGTFTVTDNGDGTYTLTAVGTNDLVIGGDATTLTELGLTAGTINTTYTASDDRTDLQTQYNTLLTQITQMAGDASFNGVNLIDGDDLTVDFNEDGTSSLTINGVDFSATGLGLAEITGDGFQVDANIDAAIAALDDATTTLRTQAATFGSNLSIVQARQDFTKNMINVLQVGADNLVLADSNEEGANMLALNTRQQLSTVALSLAAQADQNVLQLF
jgi:flagellin-like hook-associated protein FlgL